MLCSRVAIGRNLGRTRRRELTQVLDPGGIRNARADGATGSGDLARLASRKIRCHPRHGSTGPAAEPGVEEGSWQTRGSSDEDNQRCILGFSGLREKQA